MEFSSSQANAVETPLLERRASLIKNVSLDRIAFFLISAMVVLLPVAFLPALSVPFQFTKTVLALGITLLAFIVFVIARLKEGVLSLPYNFIFGALWAIPLVYFLSALFAAPHFSLSFLGVRFETDTVFFMLVMALFTTLLSLLVRTKQRILSIYTSLLAAFVILVLFQKMRLLLGTDFLSLGIFTDSTSNLLGKWNDIGIFFGLTAMLSLFTLEGLQLRPISQSVLFVVLTISLFFVALVNFAPVWITLGLFALGFFIYSFFRGKLHSRGGEGGVASVLKNPKISVLSVVVLAIASVFALFGASLGNALPNFFEISHLEARPSWQSTTDILKQTYAEGALLGSGPNTFENQWAKFKPEGINETLFWNVSFSSGIGLIPSLFVTTGILGALAWVVFLGMFLVMGVRALLLRPSGEGFSYYLTLSSFVVALYLWVFSFIYVPNAVITVFAFLFTGLFLASLRHQDGQLKEKHLVFAENPRLGFISVLVLTVVLILSLVGLYAIGQRFASATYFQNSLIELNVQGNIDAAEGSVMNALEVEELDIYHQMGAELGIIRLNQTLNSTEGTVDERRTKFQEELANAIQHAQRATELRPENFQNWLTLGRVYASVVPLQIQGAYDNAKQSLDKAKAVAPHNPQIYLALAELETLNQNTTAAKDYLNQALIEKNNYTAAVYLLAQIQIAEGDLKSALQSVEAATILAPDNPVVFFQLGLLRYNNRDFTGAVAAFQEAVRLNDAYSNARYFLGLAYYNLKQTNEAIIQFERIETLNPDNEEVKTILANLRGGKTPLSGIIEDPEPPRAPIEGE